MCESETAENNRRLIHEKFSSVFIFAVSRDDLRRKLCKRLKISHMFVREIFQKTVDA